MVKLNRSLFIFINPLFYSHLQLYRRRTFSSHRHSSLSPPLSLDMEDIVDWKSVDVDVGDICVDVMTVDMRVGGVKCAVVRSENGGHGEMETSCDIVDGHLVDGR
ncbi:Uncharacterized protein Rs2_44824 [Raphanus sativus]|nr:Uncharacterized protein Rs2_44824 [Raphanus sativus]